jgi:hypothetical protein
MRYEVFTERAGDSWSSQFPDVPEALVRTRHHDRIELTARAVIAQALAPPESFEVDVSSYDNLGGKAVNSRTGIAEKDEATRPGTSSGTLQRLGETPACLWTLCQTKSDPPRRGRDVHNGSWPPSMLRSALRSDVQVIVETGDLEEAP